MWKHRDKARNVFKLILTLSSVLFGAQLTANVMAAPGDLDPSFGIQGRQVIKIPNSQPANMVWNTTEDIVVQPDGKILIAGGAYDTFQGFSYAVTRFNANGTLDSGFGNGGVFRYDFAGSSDDQANGIALQPDGKIVVAGSAYLAVVANGADTAFGLLRLNPNGTLDPTFGNGGVVITNFFSSLDQATEVAIQPDGKIIATGFVTQGGVNSGRTYDFALVRYQPNGSLDTTFGNGGIVFTDFNGLGDRAQTSVLQPDGKIVLAGWVYTSLAADLDFGLARYNTDGSLDTTFDGDGKVVTTFGNNVTELANAIALAPDGKLVVSGDVYNPPPIIGESGNWDVAVARYNTNGSLDNTFDGDGKFTYNSNVSDSSEGSDDVLVQPDGKILIVGDSYLIRDAVPGVSDQDLLIIRLNVNGSFDSSFANSGIKFTDFGLFNQPGAPTFGTGRTGDVDLTSTIGLQPDGKIVAACDTAFSRNDKRLAIARYQNDISSNTVRRAAYDFDGDLKSDISLFRPSDATWYLMRSAQGFNATQFGIATDRLAPADFDGDGQTDLAVFRNGNWYILQSSNNQLRTVQFGTSGDVSVPADYDGDAKADVAVFRQGTWYVLESTTSQLRAVQFGASSDRAVPADYDGDGKTDFAVFRGGTWYLLRSQAGLTSVQFGLATDVPVACDYDGDRKADIGVFRDGAWYMQQSTAGFRAVHFGTSGDVAVPADYDGDGKTDIAVFRSGLWYMLQSQNGFVGVQFGIANDAPIASAHGLQ